MLHHLKLTLRRLLRHSSHSLINILGLAIGITSCLLIYLYVHDELSYDAYNLKKDRIARITATFHTPESGTPLAITPILLTPFLIRDFPEIESAVRLQPADVAVRQGSEVFKQKDLCYSEQSIFNVFTFTFLEGSAKDALTSPRSMLLARSLEEKYFGRSRALGKTLICDGQAYKITGVIADRPANSDIPILGLLYKDFSTASSWVGDDFSVYTFALFRSRPDWPHFTSRLPQLEKYALPQLNDGGTKGYRISYQAEMLKDLHFSAGKLGDTPKGNHQFNTIFSVLAIFILAIALLNYINLSTTKAIERAKEVGVRKVIGARPIQLVGQFLGESFLLIIIALLISVALSAAAIPLFNKSLDTHLSLGGWHTLLFLALLFPLIVVGGGLYPAFVLSAYAPIKVLKGDRGYRSSSGKGRGIVLRKVLTMLQFVIALGMLTGTAVIYSQMQYIAHKDQGVDRNQVLNIVLPDTDSVLQSRSKAFCDALRQESSVREMTVGSGLPLEGASLGTTTVWSDNGKKRDMLCRYYLIDPQFLSMLKIPVIKGRNLSDSFSTDKTEAFVVNEALVSKMGWKNPIGQRMEAGDRKGRVIGVIRNFISGSLHNAIEPTAMIYTYPRATAVLVKLTPATLPRLKEIWKAHFPDLPFDYSYLDKEYMEQYDKDRMTMFLFNAFSGLAIFLSCLGLYGLVALVTLQRTKEIGVRKVLGASLLQLMTLQSKDQVVLIVWAATIALPLAGIAGQRWLSTYAWHAQLSVWIFVWPAVVILLLALAVTGLRVLRSALANPIDSLRME
ncbi:MAG TPA: ABC transporter permease [Puia sp.]|jgi:putative ABC transport system permease protein|nr:ABC transporter permease [Puia sp.]